MSSNIKNILFNFKIALDDISASLSNFNLFIALAFHDIKSRYTRSRLGPWWITLNMFILISILAFIFGNIFDTDIDQYIPHLAFGFLIWNYISNSIIDGSSSLNQSSDTILQVALPLSIHIFKIQVTNIFIFLHHLILVPILMIFFPEIFSWKLLLALPGFIILTINLMSISIIFSILSARFKDFAELVKNLMQIAFYLTPVIWMPDFLVGRIGADLLNFNLFFHFINLVREPLQGNFIHFSSWVISFSSAFLFLILALFVFGKNKKNIPYWV